MNEFAFYLLVIVSAEDEWIIHLFCRMQMLRRICAAPHAHSSNFSFLPVQFQNECVYSSGVMHRISFWTGTARFSKPKISQAQKWKSFVYLVSIWYGNIIFCLLLLAAAARLTLSFFRVVCMVRARLLGADWRDDAQAIDAWLDVARSRAGDGRERKEGGDKWSRGVGGVVVVVVVVVVGIQCVVVKKLATVCRYIKIKRIGGRHRSKKLCEIMAEIKMPRLSDLSPNIWLRSDIYSTFDIRLNVLGSPFLFISFFFHY